MIQLGTTHLLANEMALLVGPHHISLLPLLTLKTFHHTYFLRKLILYLVALKLYS